MTVEATTRAMLPAAFFRRLGLEAGSVSDSVPMEDFKSPTDKPDY
jgi:hypothetical protein